MSSSAITLDARYGYTVLGAIALGLHCSLQGAGVVRLREKLFKDKALLESDGYKALNEAHRKAFGTDLDGLGFPETGGGRLAALLSDEDWLRFQGAQRCQLNYLESMPLYVISVALGGLYYPIPAAGAAGGIILGRSLYTSGYMEKGAPGRMLGLGVSSVGVLAAFGMAVFGGLRDVGALRYFGL